MALDRAAEYAGIGRNRRGCVLGSLGDDGDVLGQVGEGSVEVRAAPRQIHVLGAARRSAGGLARLADGLVGDAAGVYNCDVFAVWILEQAACAQPLAHRFSVGT